MRNDVRMHGGPPPVGRFPVTYGSGRPLFNHDDGVERRGDGTISSTTRYLSAAAYVDESYARVVIDELVADSHRAVAPSLGYDIPTVVRHCFRAQRLWLIQNALITAILIIGLVEWPSATIILFVLCWSGSLLTRTRSRESRRSIGKTVLVAVVALTVVSFLFGLLVTITGGAGNSAYSDGSDTGVVGGARSTVEDVEGETLVRPVAAFVIIGLCILLTLIWSRHRMITTINVELAHGRPQRPGHQQSREVEHRLRVIESAQHGNVVLHAGFEPFVGAGEKIRVWSIATELRPDDGAGPHDEAALRDPSGARPAPGTRNRVAIDPVELVGHVRQRLAALRSRSLPEHERISGLQLRDQVISSGTRWRDFPLIDDQIRLPYPFATRDAVDAIIRAPQTGARHFLRATVGAAEKAVVSDDGRTIMPAEHQSVVNSTYLHVAVEGGMLYVEFVATVLGPIQQKYLDIDRYDSDTDAQIVATGEALRRFAAATAQAPVGLLRAILRAATLKGATHRADRAARDKPVYDFGAWLDIRELASRNDFANYLQRLDAEKYMRLIDRRATEAIDEFLTAKGIDTSDFSAKVNFNQYNSTNIGGSAYGPVATGTAASATMATSTTANSGKGKGAGS